MWKIVLVILIVAAGVSAGGAGHNSIFAVIDLEDATGAPNCHNRSLTAAVGDSLAGEFRSRLEIGAWGGECSFAVDLSRGGGSVRAASLKMQNGDPGIEWDTGDNMSHDIYRLDNGDLEWAIVLDSAPFSNRLSFAIETDNLVFYYQDSSCFTDEVVYSGPDWAQGSYAVYHAHRRNNRVIIHGGDTLRELYATGKVFHIRRPQAFDKDGARCWCDMHIDTVRHLLSIETPAAFLDRAVYPVVIDPTFGKSPVGAWSLGIVNYRHTALWNIGAVETGEGEITGAYVYCDVNGDLEGSCQTKVHSYTKGGDPEHSMYHASSATTMISDTSAHWAACSMSGHLESGKTYMATLQGYNSVNNKLRIRADVAGWGDIIYADPGGWDVPGSLTGYANKNEGFSAYIEYTLDIGGDTLSPRRRKILK